ncbi:hypothetical protein [Neptunomonas phycophila]|uniref:hypothetical protein n=1 Tax=Neptunomonas phycophila TaxID=1572645 RepID=UPI000948A046|nr:hypothetical protein [Neptunomonas phycophila]
MRIFPSEAEEKIVLVIISFVVGIIIGLLSVSTSEVAIKATLTLSATFVGGYFAFKLNTLKDKKKEDAINVTSGNMAIFRLIRIFNGFNGYKKQFIDPFRDSPFKHVEIRPSIGLDSWDIKFDYEPLSYLLASSSPNLIAELASLNDEVVSTIEMMRVRNTHHADIVQPLMEKSGFYQGAKMTIDELDEMLGERLSDTMKELTSDMIEFVDSIATRTEKVINDMHMANKALFPKHQIVKMQKLNKSIQPTANASAD